MAKPKTPSIKKLDMPKPLYSTAFFVVLGVVSKKNQNWQSVGCASRTIKIIKIGNIKGAQCAPYDTCFFNKKTKLRTAVGRTPCTIKIIECGIWHMAGLKRCAVRALRLAALQTNTLSKSPLKSVLRVFGLDIHQIPSPHYAQGCAPLAEY